MALSLQKGLLNNVQKKQKQIVKEKAISKKLMSGLQKNYMDKDKKIKSNKQKEKEKDELI